jgi:hypothetical protein
MLATSVVVPYPNSSATACTLAGVRPKTTTSLT